MTVIFPAGKEQFSEENIEISITNDGYLTSEKADTYYFSIQGHNRIGKNIPYITDAITLSEGSNLHIKVKGLKWAEEWIFIVIGVSKTSDPNTFSQVLKIPGKFAGIYGVLLSENYKSAIPPRDFWQFYNYSFVAPFEQVIDPWDVVDLKIAGRNIEVNEAELGLEGTWEVTGNILIDKQLETFESVETITDVPDTREEFFNQFTGNAEIAPYSIPLNGHLIQVQETGYIYEYDAYDNSSEIDGVYTLAPSQVDGDTNLYGRWKIAKRWDINVNNVFTTVGSHQNIARDGDLNLDNQLILPNFFQLTNKTVESPPIVLWLTNYSQTAFKRFNRISTEVRIGDNVATEFFSGKIAVSLLGYVDLTTFNVRIRDSQGVLFKNLNSRLMIHPWQNPLQLPDELQSGEAVILRYELLIEPEEFKGVFAVDSYLKIIPQLTRGVGVFLPFGSMFGAGLILADAHGYNRRILPGRGLTANALPGSGIVQGFAFPYKEAQVVANLPANTPNIAIYLSSEGFCFARDYNNPPPEAIGYGLRATVSTSIGKSELDKFRGTTLNFNDPIIVSDNDGGFVINVYHKVLYGSENALDIGEPLGQVRGDLPDVIAGFPCHFNCLSMDIIIRRDVFSDVNDLNTYTHTEYMEFENVAIATNVINQLVTIINVNEKTRSRIFSHVFKPAIYAQYFGIYTPPHASVTDSSEGNFPNGIYYVGARYNYNGGHISRISHDTTEGHLREVAGGLDKLLENKSNEQYWSVPVGTLDHLAVFPYQHLWEGKIVLCKATNSLYRFTYYYDEETEPNDGYYVIKHNGVASGAWLMVGERGVALEPYDVILPIGNNLIPTIWGKGLKLLSGQYKLNNDTSPILPSINLTEGELRLKGVPSNWNTQYNQLWMIRDFNNNYGFHSGKNSIFTDDYYNPILIGKLIPYKKNFPTYYFHKDTALVNLSPFNKLTFLVDYAGESGKIIENYRDKRLRNVGASINVDSLIIVLKELNPRYVFIDNFIRWDNLQHFVLNTEEYFAWLLLNDETLLTNLATALDISVYDFTKDKGYLDLHLLTTSIKNTLIVLEKNNIPAYNEDYWIFYIDLINYCLVEFDLLEQTIATSAIAYDTLYSFVYVRTIPYSGGEVVPQEIVYLDNSGNNPYFGGAQLIIPDFDTSKTTENKHGFSDFMFNPPSPHRNLSVTSIPQSEWGSYNKLPQDWNYGDITPSNFIPNTYEVFVGYGYNTNSSKIFGISLNPYLEDSFPRLTEGTKKDWVKSVSSILDIYDSTNNTIHLSSQDDQQLSLSTNQAGITITLEHNDNTIQLIASDDFTGILINGEPLIN